MLREEFRDDSQITIDARWKDIEKLVEERKGSKPLYIEATPMDILTAFEDTIKELEREEA